MMKTRQHASFVCCYQSGVSFPGSFSVYSLDITSDKATSPACELPLCVQL